VHGGRPFVPLKDWGIAVVPAGVPGAPWDPWAPVLQFQLPCPLAPCGPCAPTGPHVLAHGADCPFAWRTSKDVLVLNALACSLCMDTAAWAMPAGDDTSMAAVPMKTAPPPSPALKSGFLRFVLP